MTRVLRVQPGRSEVWDAVNSHHCPESCKHKYEEARNTFGYNHWYACDAIAEDSSGYDAESGDEDCSTCSPQGSSRDAESIKRPDFFAPEIDLRHIRLAYTDNIWGLRYLFSELRTT